jgi:hypothetical protein
MPAMPERLEQATMPSQEPERTTEAVRRALQELAKLDRYESRAALVAGSQLFAVRCDVASSVADDGGEDRLVAGLGRTF